MEYNTQLPNVRFREYGRNIEKLVAKAIEIEDPEKRKQVIDTIINMMAQLNPKLKNFEDFRHKLWDHMFVMTDFKLNVDAPYEMPDQEELTKVSPRMDYPKKKYTDLQYGKNVLTMIGKAKELEDEEKKKAYIQYIGNYMKIAQQNWGRENITDELIAFDLNRLLGDDYELDENMQFRGVKPGTSRRRDTNDSSSNRSRSNNRRPNNNRSSNSNYKRNNNRR